MKKKRKEGVRDVHTRTEGRQTFPLQCMGSQNSDVSSMRRETETNLQAWNFDSMPSESRN